MIGKGTLLGSVATILVVAVSGCGDLLSVSDPQRYTDSDLDSALPAVANGVEGAVHAPMDNYVIYQALLADEYQHTGTWTNYDETDHGRITYGATNPMSGVHDAWLIAQRFATEAEERFKTELGEAEAASSELTAQVRLAGAFADLYMGMTFCEGVGEAEGTVVTDMQLFQQATQKFTDAIQTAQSAGRTDYVMAAQAGRAQANLALDRISEAATDAAAIPDGFVYEAVFNQNATNAVVNLTTKTFNEAAGLMHPWWDAIELSNDPGFMRDPWTGEFDKRIPVYFDGEVATDNATPHYSQWKYNALTANIPMVHSDGMRLIQAEAMAATGDLAGATAVLNQLREAVDLAPFETAADVQTMLRYLMTERFAELFMEGHRAVDLYRWGLTATVFGEIDDPDRPATGRPTKFPMSYNEALYNANVEDDLSIRCLPVS